MSNRGVASEWDPRAAAAAARGKPQRDAFDLVAEIRAVDLNSLCYFVGIHLEEDPAAVKSAGREYVVRNRTSAAWHDAGYDAAGALLVLQWLLAGLRNEREPATL